MRLLLPAARRAQPTASKPDAGLQLSPHTIIYNTLSCKAKPIIISTASYKSILWQRPPGLLLGPHAFLRTTLAVRGSSAHRSRHSPLSALKLGPRPLPLLVDEVVQIVIGHRRGGLLLCGALIDHGLNDALDHRLRALRKVGRHARAAELQVRRVDLVQV